MISNWYTNSILNQLVQKNVQTTEVVELTASIENELYQSLITLTSLKDAETVEIGSITLNEPTTEMYEQSFERSLLVLKEYFTSLEQSVISNLSNYTPHLRNDVEVLNDRFQLYEQLCIEWITFRNEDQEQARLMFSTSVNPYFRNNIIPVISHLRTEVINQQNVENLQLDEQLNRAGITIFSITSFLVFISIGIAMFLYRSIANPLKKLKEGVQILGEGNLDERVEVNNKDEIGLLAETFNSMADNLRKRTLARDYLDNIIESIHESLIVTDEKGMIVGLNQATEQLLGYTKAELNDTPLFQLFEKQQAIIQKRSPIATQDRSSETFLKSKFGKKIPVLLSESNLLNNKDEFVGKVVVATDITERNRANEQIRESLREKEILLAEIHHRVKNNLAVVSGILQLQSKEAENKQVEEVLLESQTRIKSISLVHEMLYQSETMANIEYDKYVEDLTREISKLSLAFENNVQLTTTTEPLLIDLNIAVPCSMLLNEIIIDRLKHAFTNFEDGRIRVVLRNLETNAELTVEHNGHHVTHNSAKESLGHTLIKTLINQLHGTYYEEQLEEQGISRIRIIFPLHVQD